MGALQQLPVVIIFCEDRQAWPTRSHMRLYARVFKRACVYKCPCVRACVPVCIVDDRECGCGRVLVN